jgi:hypothetical protein
VTAFSDYFEAAILNWFRGTTFPAATGSVYSSLHTATTTDAGGGTEVSGNAYARQALSKASGTWTAPAAAGNITNTAEVAFPAATPATWGTVTHSALWDASTTGNMLMHGALTASKTVNADDVFRFPIGALSITVA